MFNFLHTHTPEPILIALGPINIYWYGFFIIVGVLLASLISIKLAEKYNIKKEFIVDLIFWLIIGGIVGARIYHVILELPFYLSNPLSIIKLWEGGLAIHGAIFAGIITVWYLVRKQELSSWQIAAITLPGLALAQAIGRWGNYFNQELFGRPTTLPWSIPIEPAQRIAGFLNSEFFHPTFLYESIGSIFIFILLILIHSKVIKKTDPGLKNFGFQLIVFSYLILYSILRFLTEFIRIDPTPTLGIFRLPQIVSLIIIVVSGVFLLKLFPKIKNLSHLDKSKTI